MSPFLQKATTAVHSAELLLDAGDTDGATSRGYYAMFESARAMLDWAGVAPERGNFKTHNGLLTAFSQHLVKPGLFPADFGKAIQRAQAVRQLADYEPSEVPLDAAKAIVEAARKFVEAASALVAEPYVAPSV